MPLDTLADMGEFIGLVAVVLIFGIPILAVWTEHQRKMIKLKSEMGQGTDNVRHELEEIKRQISSLRDTTTGYDISFDTALQRLEGRMNTVEDRVTKVETEQVNAQR